MINYGKEWEKRFASQWRNSFPKNILERLYDQVSGYKTVSQNPADYYAFVNKKLIYLECKETNEGTLNFSKFPQLDRLLEKVKYEDVLGFVVIWFRKYKKVVMVSVDAADKIRNDGNASIALSMLNEKSYNILEISATFARTYPKCDFSNIKEIFNDK